MLYSIRKTGLLAVVAALGSIAFGPGALAPSAFSQGLARAPGGLRVQANPQEKPARIDPAAESLLKQVESAYSDLKSARISGTVSLEVESQNFSRKTSQPFTSSFESPNKFRHQLKNILLNCDGTNGYAFDQNERAYLKFPAPNRERNLEEMPEIVPNVLQMQNPSLLFALVNTPAHDLAKDFGGVTKLADQEIAGVKCSVLRFGSAASAHSITLLIDPKTHLMRKFILDFTPALKRTAGSQVKTAMLSVDYTSIAANPSLDRKQFAWTPPEGALDMKEAAGAESHPDTPMDDSDDDGPIITPK